MSSAAQLRRVTTAVLTLAVLSPTAIWGSHHSLPSVGNDVPRIPVRTLTLEDLTATAHPVDVLRTTRSGPSDSTGRLGSAHADTATAKRSPRAAPSLRSVQLTIALRADASSRLAEVRQLIRYLQAAGLSTQTGGWPPTTVWANGTAGQINELFDARLEEERGNGAAPIEVFASAPKLPATLAPLVEAVFARPSTRATAAVVAANQEATLRIPIQQRSATLVAQPAAVTAGGPPVACAAASAAAAAAGAHTPADIASHYNLTPLYASAAHTAVTVAIVEFEPFDPGDIASFQACYGTHASVTVVPVDGGVGPGVGSGRAAADIETVIATAPEANILVYEAPGDAGSIYDTYARIANDHAAQIVVSGWGICEPTARLASLPTLERPLFQRMALQGQTVLAASGDTGSAGCYNPPNGGNTAPAVLDPASQPEVVAVGGTSFAAADSADTSWRTGSGAGGGGISQIWPEPRYQQLVSSAPENSGAPCGAQQGSLCRQVPDISLLADPTHGYVVFFGGAWHATGGTALAAATLAGGIALVDRTCAAGPVGWIGPTLYRAAGSTAIVDITQGPNTDFTGVNSGEYAVRSGYDLATGLGYPNMADLQAWLCPPTAAPGAGTMTVTPNLVQTDSLTALSFRYQPPTGTGLINGEIDINVPGTWTLPSTQTGQAGFTTADAGIVLMSGNTIVLRAVSLPPGATVTITYGDTNGGSSARTPPTSQITTFAAQSAASATQSPLPLRQSPAVRVLTPGSSSAGEGTLLRVAGSDRIATAIAASQLAFPGSASARAVVLARSDTFPDALAGAPLAASVRGPLLLTPPTEVPANVLSEIQRVLPQGSPVFLLGGFAALSAQVEQQILNAGFVAHRIQGADRYETAVQIAYALGNPTTLLEVDGTNFPDAMSAAAAAIITHGALLLTDGDTLSAATRTFLSTHLGSTRFAIGGPAAHADPSSRAIVGTDRFATSVLVAQQFFTAPSAIGLASGAAFPDALVGGPISGTAGGPLVLVPPDGNLPDGTSGYFASVAPSVLNGWLFGGPKAVTTTVADAAAQALVLLPPTN